MDSSSSTRYEVFRQYINSREQPRAAAPRYVYEVDRAATSAGTPRYAAISGLERPEPQKPVHYERRWRHHLLNICGDGGEDCAAFTFACHCPCLAYGLNSQRALNKNYCFSAVAFFLLGSLLYYVGIIGGGAALLRLCPEMDVSRDVAGRDVDLGGPASGICRKAVLANYLIWLLAVPGYLLLVVWAARRRTAMRAAFSIPGSCGGDCCAWLCCGVCALAQETRTLMHNNCYAGQWLGPIDAATLRVQEADRFLPPAQQPAPTV